MIRYNDDKNRFRAPTVEEILQRYNREAQTQSLPARVERFDLRPDRYLTLEAPLEEEEPVVEEEPTTENNNSTGNWFTRALDTFAHSMHPSGLPIAQEFSNADKIVHDDEVGEGKALYTYAGKEGLSVLKSKYQDELMEGPARYKGEILLALAYVRAKDIVDTFDVNLLLEEGFTNTPAYDEYTEALNFVWLNEPTVKEIAKRNPYLRDIFYAPNSGTFPAIQAGAYWRSAWNEWSNNHFFDLNPFNNLEHALEDNALTKLQEDYLWNRQANNLTAEDKIKLLDDAIAENDEEYDRKTQQILNVEDVLRNGNWWFDPAMLTPEFAAKVDSSELSLTDPSSWFYNLGHLGSSYSEALMMLGLMGTAVGAKAAAKWVVPFILKNNKYTRALTTLLAVGEAAGNLAFARYFRHAETASEVFDNYQLQLLNKMQDPNSKMELSPILGEYIEGLLNLGYDTDNFTDDEVLAAGLAHGIVTSDPEFEKIRKDAYNGLLEIRDVNDALSWSDYLETLPFSYGGKLMWNAAKRTKAAKVLGLNISKVTTPVTQATRWARELTIDRAWNKVLDKYGTSTYMTARAIAREALAFARRTALIAASEATEEGIQYNVGYQYGKGKYDKLGDVGISGPRSLWDMGKLGLQSHLAFWGLSRDKGLNTDKDLENAMKIGGFIGIMNPLSAGSSVKSAMALRNLLRANEPLNDLVSNGYAHAEDDIKYDAYIKALHQGKNGAYITDYLKTLKKAKGEGVTDEMIDDDIKKAQRLIDFYNFKGNDDLLKDLGIARNSEDFDRYVKNYMHIMSDLDDLNDDVTTTRKRLHDLLEDSKNNKDDLFNITVKALYEQYSEAWNRANEKALAEEDKVAGTVPPQATTAEVLLTPTAQTATEQTPTIESQPVPTTEGETTPTTEGQESSEEQKPILEKPEPKRIAKKMASKMTEEEFQEYIFNLVSGNEQLKALKQLKRRLQRQSKTIAELAKSTNVALNNGSVRSITNTVDKQIKRLEKQVKGQAGRIFRSGSSLEENLKGIPIKNTSEIREITAINAIETAVRDLLANKRDAYVTGQISPENMQDVHGVFFNELDLEERDTEIARQRKDNPQKTIPEIRRDYDRAISDMIVSDKERVIPSEKLRKELGRLLIKAELSLRRQDERIAHQEKVEDGQAMPDNWYPSPTPVATLTRSATSKTSNTTSLKGALALSDEQTKPTNNIPAKPQEKGGTEKGRTNQQVPPEAGGTEEGTELIITEGEQPVRNNPTEGKQELPATPEREGGAPANQNDNKPSTPLTPPTPPESPTAPGSTGGTEEGSENKGQKEGQEGLKNQNEQPKDTNEGTEEEKLGLQEQVNTLLGKPAATQEELQSPDDSELPGEDPDLADAALLENLANEGDDNVAQLVNTELADDGVVQLVQSESPEESTAIPLGDGLPPGWDDSADPNLTMSDARREEYVVELLDLPDSQSTDDTAVLLPQVVSEAADIVAELNGAAQLNNAAGSLVNPERIGESVTTGVGERVWHFSETAFYQPSSLTPMNPTATVTENGKRKTVLLNFGKNSKGKKLETAPGAELAEKLLDPKWIKGTKLYYVVGTPDYANNKDRESSPIYLAIEDDEDGKVYLTALRTPEHIDAELNDPRRRFTDELRLVILEEKKKLEAARKIILDTYLGVGNNEVPVNVRKDVVPSRVEIGNGPLNNQVNVDNRPIFQKLTDVLQLGLSKDNVQELDKQVRKLEFGYGTGEWHSGVFDRAIRKLGSTTEETSGAQGLGRAGAIYLVPPVSITPNQKTTVPIQLHLVKFGERIKDWQGRNKVSDWEGTIPYYLLQLFTNYPNLAGSSRRSADAIMNFLLHFGVLTYATKEDDQLIPDYSLKMFLCDTTDDSMPRRFLFTRKFGNKIYRYNWNATNLTESKKVQIMKKIAADLHFNTDKMELLRELPKPIVELAEAFFRENGTDKPFKLGNCNELSFSAEDIGFNAKTGKAESPISQLTWLLNTGKITTDLGDTIYKAPYVHCSGCRQITTAQGESETVTQKKGKLEKSAEKPTKKKTISKTEKPAELAKPEKPESNVEVKPNEEKPVISDPSEVRKWLNTAEDGKYKDYSPSYYVIYTNPKTGKQRPILRQLAIKKGLIDGNAGLASTERGSGTINLESAINWLHDVLGIDREDIITSTAIFRMAQAPKVYGLLRASMDLITGRNAAKLYLSSLAGEGIEYHEAFHYVSLLLLSDLLRELVYEDFVKANKQYLNATKQEVEELLAEAFRSYMIDEKNNTLRYRVKKAFNAIKKVLGLHRDGRLVDSIFSKIRGGEFAKYSPSQQLIDNFAERYNGGLYYYIPGVPEELVNNMHSIADSATFYRVVDSLFAQVIGSFKIENISELGKKIDNVFSDISENLDAELYSDNESTELLIKDVLENKEVFKAQINSLLRSLSIEQRNNREAQTLEEESKDSGDNNENSWDKESYTINKKDNVAFRAKMFFLSIPMMRRVYNSETGQVELLPEVDPLLLMTRSYSFDIAWNKVLDALWNVDNWVDLVNECNVRSGSDVFFASLYNKLINPEEQVFSDLMLLTQILNTVKSAKNSLITLTTELNQEGSKNTTNNVNMSIKDSNNFTYISRLPNKWSQSFFVSDFFDVVNGRRVLNKTKFENFIGKRKPTKSLSATKRNQNYGLIGNIQDILDKPASTWKLEDYENVKSTFIALCNRLCISMDSESFDHLMSMLENGKADLETFKTFWDEKDPKISFVSLLASLYQSAGKVSAARAGNRPFDSIFKSKNEKSQINQIAIAWGTTHPSPETFSVLGPDGKIAYPITENNYMSDQLRWLKADKEGKRTILEQNPFSAGSMILAALRDGADPRMIKLHTFLGCENLISHTNNGYLELSPREDYLMKLTFGFSNHLFCPTMSDKKTWHTISGLRITDLADPQKGLRSLILKEFVPTLTAIGDDVISTERRFSRHALLLFKNYLTDELNAVRQYYATKLLVLDNPGKFVENYYGTKKGNYADGNGGRFRYFSSLKLRDENGALQTYNVNTELAKAEYANSIGAINQVLNTVLALLNDNEKCLDAINEMLVEFAGKEVAKAIELDIIGADKDGLLFNKSLPTNFIKNLEKVAADSYADIFTNHENANIAAISKSDLVWSMIASHALNSAISTIEIEKIFTGDPALYKQKKLLMVYNVNDSQFEAQPLGDQTLEGWFAENGKDGERIEDYNCYYAITNRDADKLKRLSGVLSTGTNLRTDWNTTEIGQENEMEGVFDKFNVLQLADNFVGSDVYDTLYDAFKRAIVIDTLVSRAPESFNYHDRDTFGNEEWVKKNDPHFYEVNKYTYEYAARRAKIEAKPYANGNVNQTDAAAYISPRMYENILKSLGKWNNEIEEAFRLMESDDEWLSDPVKYAKAIKAITQPLKMVYFGDHFDNELGLNVNTFDKMAIFPLFKSFAKGDNKFLYDRMNNDELGAIHMVVFGKGSTVKVGSRDLLDFYKGGKPNLAVLNKQSSLNGNHIEQSNPGLPVYELSLSQLRLQLNTDPHEDTDRTVGTLALKVGLSNIIDDQVYGTNKGLSVTGLQIKLNIFEALANLTINGAYSVRQDFFALDEKYGLQNIVDNKKVSKYLQRMALTSGLSSELIASLACREDGNINIPIEALSVRSWIQQRVIKYINGKVVDTTTPGGTAIQMSQFGYNTTEAHNKTSEAFNGGKKLKFLAKEGQMEVMLSENFFRYLLPKKLQNASFAEKRAWLLENNIIGENAKPFAIGYRVPTQGLSSMFGMTVADILPTTIGDTIIVPDEFTAMTGSDFDVDKIYIMSYEYDTDNENNTATRTEYQKGSTGRKQNVNKLIDNYMLVLTDFSNISLTRASIDTLTNILKQEILPLIEPASTEEVDPFYELSPAYLVQRKIEFADAKAGIGPFALNITHHALTQAVHLTMNYALGNRYGLRPLDGIFGDDKYRIEDWLSAMINAHVDVAKDPYIMKLNVNKITWNIANLLLRGGKGYSTFLFLAQPAIREFTRRLSMQDGFTNPHAVKTQYQILNKLGHEYTARLIEAAQSLPQDDKRRSIHSFNDMLEGDDSTAMQVFDEKSSRNALNDPDSVDGIYHQLLCIRAYRDLMYDATLLSQLVLFSQIDTKKFGNTLSELLNFKRRLDRFIDNRFVKFSITNESAEANEKANPLHDFFERTGLLRKLEYATSLSRKVLSEQLIEATAGFEKIFNAAADAFLENIGDKKAVAALANTLITSLRAKAVAASGNSAFSLDDKTFLGLLQGNGTVVKSLSNIKTLLTTKRNGVYPDIPGVAHDGVITNALLNYLQPYVNSRRKQQFDRLVTMTSQITSSGENQNRLISAFLALLDTDGEPGSVEHSVHLLANVLALYSYLTSFDVKGVETFFDLVPMQWKQSHGYTDAISNLISELNSANPNLSRACGFDSQLLENGIYLQIYCEIARNAYQNDTLVPFLDLNINWTDRYIGCNIIYNNKNGRYSILTSLDVKSRNHRGILPQFVKILADSKDKNSIALYQKVGNLYYYMLDKDGNEVADLKMTRTVYKLIPKFGAMDGGKLYSEYGKTGDLSSAFDCNKIPKAAMDYLSNDWIRNYMLKTYSPKTGDKVHTRVLFELSLESVQVATQPREGNVAGIADNGDFVNVNPQEDPAVYNAAEMPSINYFSDDFLQYGTESTDDGKTTPLVNGSELNSTLEDALEGETPLSPNDTSAEIINDSTGMEVETDNLGTADLAVDLWSMYNPDFGSKETDINEELEKEQAPELEKDYDEDAEKNCK